MKDSGIKRRRFMQGTAGALFLAGLPGHRVEGAELVYDTKLRFPLTKGVVPSEEVRILAGYLESYSPPEGTMGAQGGWTAVYDILKFEATPAYKKKSRTPMYNMVLGQVAITKRAASSVYEIKMAYQPTRSMESIDARISCSDGPVAALKNWEMDWSCRGTGGGVSYTNREQGTVAADHFSVTSRGHTDRIALRRPLTCLWTLFDAVRHLPPRVGSVQSFDMYMDLSSLRRNQSLSFSGSGQVALATGLQKLNFYEQLGEGIEPIHYAVDDQQRTLFITQGQLGWGLNRIEEV